MKIINHLSNCKKILIYNILKTNDNLSFFPIFDNFDLVQTIISSYKDDDFYKILAFFNNNNYIGYFARKEKLNLCSIINKKQHIKSFLDNWLENKYYNQYIIDIEASALNLLLEKMVLKGHNQYHLDDLEEIKLNFFASTETIRRRVYNFKTKIILSNGKEYDLYDMLIKIIQNRHNLTIRDLMFLKNYYQEELEFLSNK